MPSTILPSEFTAESTAPAFIDRREPNPTVTVNGRERRQFANSHDHLSPEAGELAQAIDQYKLQHRRRFINFEEMLSIMKSLGYSK